MPLLTCTIRSVPRPFALVNGGTSATAVRLVAPATMTWSDGTVDPTWTPGPFFAVLAAGTGAGTVDTTLFAWLIVAVKGKSTPVLVQEGQLGTALDGLLGGTPSWAPLYRIIGTTIESYPQQTGGSGNSLPTGTKGDLLYFDGTAWVVRHIGNPTDVLYVDPVSGTPIWEPLAALATLLPSVTTAVSTPMAGAVLDLGTNGAPPLDGAGRPWYDPAFDATGWAAPVAMTLDDRPFYTLPTGASWISFTPGNAPTGEQWLLRAPFTLPAGAINAVNFQINYDDQLLGLYLNGTQVSGVASHTGTAPIGPTTFTIPTTQLLPGATNLLAAFIKNAAGPTAFAFRLAAAA